jgi:hypothetical protein
MIAEKNGEAKIKLPKKDLVREHKHLLGVLRTGSKASRMKEAKDQAGELKEYRAAKVRKVSRGGRR